MPRKEMQGNEPIRHGMLRPPTCFNFHLLQHSTCNGIDRMFSTSFLKNKDDSNHREVNYGKAFSNGIALTCSMFSSKMILQNIQKHIGSAVFATTLLESLPQAKSSICSKSHRLRVLTVGIILPA